LLQKYRSYGTEYGQEASGIFSIEHIIVKATPEGWNYCRKQKKVKNPVGVK